MKRKPRQGGDSSRTFMLVARQQPPSAFAALLMAISRAMPGIERIFVVIALVVFANLLIFIVIGAPAEDPASAAADPGPVARASWYPVYFGLLIAAVCRAKTIGAALLKLWPVLLILFLAAMSIAWSINPELTQRRVVALAFTFLFGIYLALRGPWRETLRLMGYAWLFLAVFNLLLIMTNPAVGVHQSVHVGAWRGFVGEKNQLGGEMSRAHILFMGLFALDPKNRMKWGAGLALTLLLIIGSTSKTALLATFVPYLILGFGYVAKRSRILAVLSLWAAASAIAGGWFILTNFPNQVVAFIGRDLTFTGRTEIWSLAIDLIVERKWSGYGYAAFWVTPDGPAAFIRDALDWGVPTAHNSWLEAGLGMGAPGIAALGLAVLMALGRAAWLSTGRYGLTLFVMIVQLILFSLSESLLLEQNIYSTVLFVFALSHALTARFEPASTAAAAARKTRWDNSVVLPRRIP